MNINSDYIIASPVPPLLISLYLVHIILSAIYIENERVDADRNLVSLTLVSATYNIRDSRRCLVLLPLFRN